MEEKNIDDLHALQNILDNNNITADTLLTNVSTNCSDLRTCFWKGKTFNCDTFSQPIYTSIGLCCSFNYYALPNLNK